MIERSQQVMSLRSVAGEVTALRSCEMRAGVIHVVSGFGFAQPLLSYRGGSSPPSFNAETAAVDVTALRNAMAAGSEPGRAAAAKIV